MTTTQTPTVQRPFMIAIYIEQPDGRRTYVRALRSTFATAASADRRARREIGPGAVARVSDAVSGEGHWVTLDA